MKWTDEKLDELFQQHKPVVPEYSTDFWKEMERQLPTEKRNRKRLLLWLNVFFILSAGATIVILLNHKTKDLKETTDTKAYAIQTNSIQKKKAVISSKSYEKEQISAEHQQENKSKQVESTKVATNEELAPDLHSITEIKQEKISFQNEKILLETIELEKQTVQLSRKNIGGLSLEKGDYRPKYSIHLGIGFGQSPMKNTQGYSSNQKTIVSGFHLYEYAGNLRFSFGGQLIYINSGNIILKQNESTNKESLTKMSHLFGLQFPVQISRKTNKLNIGLSLIPGIQALYKGTFIEYIDGTETRREEKIGVPKKAQTTTLQLGVVGEYQLTEKLGITGQFSTGILKPFYSTAYLGQEKQFPLQIQLGIHRYLNLNK